MAQNVTLLGLRTRARSLADMRGSSFLSDSEITTLANVHIQDLDDLIAEAAPPHYYATDHTITTAAGTIAYALPSDFRNVIRVYAQEGSTTRLRPLMPIQPASRHVYDAPQGAYAVTLRYRPVTAALSSDSDTYDGVAGWDEYVVSLMVRDMLAAEEQDIGWLDIKIERLRQRVMANAPKRDLGGPDFIAADPERYGSARQYWRTNALAGYEIRAGYIDLFQQGCT